MPLDHDATGADAYEALLLVEERVLQARAQSLLDKRRTTNQERARLLESSLVRRAAAALRSVEPPPSSPWVLLQKTKSVKELLANGYTYHELVACGVTLPQLLALVPIDDVRTLGCTYESLLASGLRVAVEERRLTLKDCLSLQPDVRALITDGVIRSVVPLHPLEPAEFARLKLTADVLVRELNMGIDGLIGFRYHFETWVNHLGLRPSHLRELYFVPARDATAAGWTYNVVESFMRSAV